MLLRSVLLTSVVFCALCSQVFTFSMKMNRRFAVRTALSKSNSPIDSLNSQTLSYGVGSIGLIVLLVNRLSVLEELNDVQSRVDLISVMACSALLLNALTEQDIEARERDAVTLVGYSCRTPVISAGASSEIGTRILRPHFLRKYVISMPYIIATASKWICNTLLKAGPVSSVQVIQDYRIVARIGVVGVGDDRAGGELRPGKILSKSLSDAEEVYLPGDAIG